MNQQLDHSFRTSVGRKFCGFWVPKVCMKCLPHDGARDLTVLENSAQVGSVQGGVRLAEWTVPALPRKQ